MIDQILFCLMIGAAGLWITYPVRPLTRYAIAVLSKGPGRRRSRP